MGKKKEIHYMNEVRLLKGTTTNSEKFFKEHGDNNVPYGAVGTVKEVHGNNVTVDIDYSNYDCAKSIVRVFVTKDDLEVLSL